MKHKILIAVALVFFASCMKVKKKGDEDVATSNNDMVTEESSDQGKSLANRNKELNYTYLDLDKSNLAHVQFSIPSNWPKEVVVRKVELTYTSFSFDLHWQKETVVQAKNSPISESVVVPNASGLWDDFLVSENKVSFKFYSKVDKDLILLDEVEVLPPQVLEVSADLNLRDKFQLTSKTKTIYIRQLQIAENAHLYLENYSGEIIIQNLDSKSGYIQSYANEARAASDTPGLSGGSLKIKVLNGDGTLNVVMKGQDGGNGSTAKLPDSSKKGTHGEAAKRGPDFLFISGLGTSNAVNCGENIEAKNGGTGNQGYPGMDGKGGGNSGMVTIQNLSSSLEITVATIAGKKGFGTVGGAGGEGGEPGGPLAEAYGCPGAPGARPGSLGIQGEPGHDGNDGQLQKSCLINPDQTKKCINE